MMQELPCERFNAAVYIRLSSEDGDKEESNSVVNQRRFLTEYIQQQNDMILCEIYIDDGYSGTNFNRPAFQRMMKDIEAGRINCVIVKDLSRFGRDYIDCGRYLERIFPEKRIRFISVTDAIDSGKQSYDMILPIKNIFNEQYARDISQKIRTAVGTKQRAGLFIGAFPSYGYQKSPQNKNQLIVDAYAAEIVRRIFHLFAQGCGKQEIAKILNNEGILSPSAYKHANGMRYQNGRCLSGTSLWSYTTVAKILQNEMYLGNMVQGTKHQQLRGRQQTVPKEKHIIVSGTHEPIIDKKLWDTVQNLLAQKTRRMDTTISNNIFAGRLKCGDCGRAMVREVWRRKDGTPQYQFNCGTYRRNGKAFCSAHSISYQVLEQIILSDLNEILQNTDGLKQLVMQSVGRKKSHVFAEKQASILRTELEKVQRFKQSIYEDYKENLITREEYIKFRNNYAEKEQQLSEQISLWEKRTQTLCDIDLTDDLWLKHFIEHKTVSSLNHAIVTEMIHEIRIYADHTIRIVYQFSNDIAHLTSGSWRNGWGSDSSGRNE